MDNIVYLTREVDGKVYPDFKDTRNVIELYKSLNNEDIKRKNIENSYPYAVAVENILGDFNLAGIIRNACSFGAREFFYFGGKKKYDKRGTVGSHHYMDIYFLDSYEELIRLKDRYTFVAIEQNAKASSIHDIRWPLDTLMLFGEEGPGLTDKTLELADLIVEIPMLGSVRSLNAASASAVAMMNYIQQHQFGK